MLLWQLSDAAERTDWRAAVPVRLAPAVASLCGRHASGCAAISAADSNANGAGTVRNTAVDVRGCKCSVVGSAD